MSLPDEPFVLGTLARLEQQKGLDVLLAAMVTMPQAKALLAGTGSRRAELEELATTLQVSDRVRFLGPVASPCDVLGKVHALVVPSRWEAMPLAVLEAMHAGMPVVATDVGSLREIVVDGETGIVVPPQDPQALAGACLRLAGDPSLRARLGAAGRERARRDFSVTAMARQYDAHYRRVRKLP
jgi:glycosyltransferase involved in cell wall biosynthesis